MSHYIVKCSCGALISQCQCPVEWADKGTGKPITIIERGCKNCHGSTIFVTKHPADSPTKDYYGERCWQLTTEEGDSILVSYNDVKYLNGQVMEHYHGED